MTTTAGSLAKPPLCRRQSKFHIDVVFGMNGDLIQNVAVESVVPIIAANKIMKCG